METEHERLWFPCCCSAIEIHWQHQQHQLFWVGGKRVFKFRRFLGAGRGISIWGFYTQHSSFDVIITEAAAIKRGPAILGSDSCWSEMPRKTPRCWHDCVLTIDTIQSKKYLFLSPSERVKTAVEVIDDDWRRIVAHIWHAAYCRKPSGNPGTCVACVWNCLGSGWQLTSVGYMYIQT